MVQQRVDADDECDHDGRDAHEQRDDLAQAFLKRGFGKVRPDVRCDLAEFGIPTGAHDDAQRRSGANDRAVERTRRKLERPPGARRQVDRLATGIASPVRAASSHSKPCAEMSRTSAGTISPRRRTMTSPGTSVPASMTTGTPSRKAVAVRRSRRSRSATSCNDRNSLKKPNPTLIPTMTRMMIASVD